METYEARSDSDIDCTGSRKGRKLIAEKRRRARINKYLTQIKDIVCAAEKHNDPNYEKMEKAEILESTVDYLRNVRKINSAHQKVKETVQARFQQGFSRCAEEILSYVQSLPGVSDNVHNQLRKHLGVRLGHVQQVTKTSSTHHVTSHQRHIAAYQHPLSHPYFSFAAGTTLSSKDNHLDDSGYLSSPASDAKEWRGASDAKQWRSASDSELYGGGWREREERSFVETRVSSWVDSTLLYSQQIHPEQKQQQQPWRPW